MYTSTSLVPRAPGDEAKSITRTVYSALDNPHHLSACNLHLHDHMAYGLLRSYKPHSFSEYMPSFRIKFVTFFSKKPKVTCLKCGEEIALDDCFKDRAAENELKNATIRCTNQDCPWEGPSQFYKVKCWGLNCSSWSSSTEIKQCIYCTVAH